MVVEHKISIGCVKWFGGFNRNTNKENNFGFIEDYTGRDVYLNQRDWKAQTKPLETEIVIYYLTNDTVKIRATEATRITVASLKELLEILELFSDARSKLISRISTECYRKTIDAVSKRIKSTSVREVREIFENFDIKDSLYEVLETKSDWSKNQPILKDAGVLEGFLEKQSKDAAAEAQKQRIKKNIRSQLENTFEFASENIKCIGDANHVDAEKIRQEWLRQFFDNQGHDHLSDEQLAAIGDCSAHTLLAARAGSGKTTVIKHKIDFLIDHLSYKPSEIMALAFNSDAAGKIRRDLQTEFKHLSFTNARTFHSLAYQIARPKEELLFDAGSGSNAKQSQLIQDLIREEANPAFRQMLYAYFRQELEELKDTDSLLSKKDFYDLQRSRTQETLKGDAVKSSGEKWIADFLFEHGIRYVYERPWFIDGDEEKARYRPDFSLAVWGRSPDIVIEHWGIDESDTERETPPHWRKTAGEYLLEMKKKRCYWKDWNIKKGDKPVIFLETSIVDMKNGRAQFEQHLHKLLEAAGVDLRRLPEATIVDKVVNRHITKFANMCLQFVSRSKKQRLTSVDIARRINEFSFDSSKEEIFNMLALKIYRRYELELAKRCQIDFDDLINRSVETICKSNDAILVKDGPDSELDLRNVRWLLIDEYQDFSKSFFCIISALYEHGCTFKLFCVGDDWQAINGFAGSDLKFFRKFSDYFPDAKELTLQNNYRSQSNVVTQGNAFMNKAGGAPSLAKANITPEPFRTIHTNKVFIEQRAAKLTEKDPDFLYRTVIARDGSNVDLDANGEVARILKSIHAILIEEPGSLDERTFLVISRGNRIAFSYQSMAALKPKLKSCLSREQLSLFRNFDAQVVCTTAHRSKGAEADVVILLNAIERKLPILHPDSELFRLLGVSLDDVYAEEERLFYVAITRAKRRLYILTESGRESHFLKRISSGEFEIDKDLNVNQRSGPVDFSHLSSITWNSE